MELRNIEVITREKGPDSILQSIRGNGYIPGVMYGVNNQSHSIKIQQKPLSHQLKKNGKSSIFHVEFANEIVPVKINEIQRNPVDGHIVHVDLQRIEMNKLIEVAVPIHFIGESSGVKKGGTIQRQLREIKVRALPASIPEYIQVNISDLEIGEALHVRDLVILHDVAVLQEPDAVIISILSSKMEKEEQQEVPISEPEVVKARDGRGIDAAK